MPAAHCSRNSFVLTITCSNALHWSVLAALCTLCVRYPSKAKNVCVVCIYGCNLQASLASLRAEWSAELAALKTDVAHKRRVAAAALKARQEEEDIKVSALAHLAAALTCWVQLSSQYHSFRKHSRMLYKV
mgnify:CR=1 FL=1